MMPLQLAKAFSTEIQSFYYIMLLINAIIHVLFAGAVARDAGGLYKLGQRPAMVSPATWAFATLVGGIVTAAIYWFIHHSSLTRPSLKEDAYQQG